MRAAHASHRVSQSPTATRLVLMEVCVAGVEAAHLLAQTAAAPIAPGIAWAETSTAEDVARQLIAMMMTATTDPALTVVPALALQADVAAVTSVEVVTTEIAVAGAMSAEDVAAIDVTPRAEVTSERRQSPLMMSAIDAQFSCSSLLHVFAPES